VVIFVLDSRSSVDPLSWIEAMLKLTNKEISGHMYLPLTAHTIHRLSPYRKGEKPIADA
jgi:hypothetical protein